MNNDILGGSDDAAGCAVMLEVFRVISQSRKYLRYNIIFLFNGAEENILQVKYISIILVISSYRKLLLYKIINNYIIFTCRLHMDL